MSTAGDYTYDDTKIDVTGGVASLKPSYTPGTNWIAADGDTGRQLLSITPAEH